MLATVRAQVNETVQVMAQTKEKIGTLAQAQEKASKSHESDDKAGGESSALFYPSCISLLSLSV